jgi:hypothetical protein
MTRSSDGFSAICRDSCCLRFISTARDHALQRADSIRARADHEDDARRRQKRVRTACVIAGKSA